jgi:hypothetical protein
MSHLTLEQLVQLREPGLEPGVSSLREHLDACADCQAEAVRLDQRSNRLKALHSLRPARDHWPAMEQRLRLDRRRQLARRVVWMGLAAAAGFALMVTVRSRRPVQGPASEVAINEVMQRSQQLEQLIQSYNPEARVVDGRTVRVAGELEDRIAEVDRELEVARQLNVHTRDREMLGLWRQRVGLLNALVDVHMTRASAVGY